MQAAQLQKTSIQKVAKTSATRGAPRTAMPIVAKQQVKAEHKVRYDQHRKRGVTVQSHEFWLDKRIEDHCLHQGATFQLSFAINTSSSVNLTVI